MSNADTVRLLALARDTVRADLVPQSSGETRFRLAMVANAMGIASRSVAYEAQFAASEAAELAKFLDLEDRPLTELRRHLCRALRSGGFDLERESALRALFGRRVANRLAISSPDYPPRFRLIATGN